MIAIWALVAAIFFLAAVIIGVAWAWFHHSALDSLTDDEIAERLAPLAAELVVWQATHVPDPDDPELS